MKTLGKHYCGDTIYEATVTWDIDDKTITVPGHACTGCDDTMIEARTFDRLEALTIGNLPPRPAPSEG